MLTTLETAASLATAPCEGARSAWRSPRLHLETGRTLLGLFARGIRYRIRSTGELHPCPIASAALGNVKRTPLQTLIRFAEAARFRRSVTELPECVTCTEPGLERYALPFEGFHYLRQYFRIGGEAFRALHRHLGLDKYV